MALIAEVWGLLTLLFYMILSYFRVIYDLVVKPAKKNVEREIVLVTGAGHGIGREIALAFGRLGANTVLWDINKENNDATAKEIFEMGGESKSYVCDVSDPDSVRNVAERVREEVGDVTILVNNAGILHGGALLDLKDRDIQKTFGINTLSHFWTVREFLPAMLEKNRGHIVTMASMAAINGVAYLVDYSSSKWAVFGFTESLQDELRRLHRTGIKTTIVCPHFVSTGMTKFPKMTRLDDWLSPETTARIAVEGVLRNEEVVYIPRSMELPVLLQRFLTREGKRLLATALDIGIDPQYGTTTRSART